MAGITPFFGLKSFWDQATLVSLTRRDVKATGVQGSLDSMYSVKMSFEIRVVQYIPWSQ